MELKNHVLVLQRISEQNPWKFCSEFGIGIWKCCIRNRPNLDYPVLIASCIIIKVFSLNQLTPEIYTEIKKGLC